MGTISAAETKPELERRLNGRPGLRIEADPKARPGDWRVEWSEGSIGFAREDVEAAIDAVIAERLEEPVEPQLDLFAVA